MLYRSLVASLAALLGAALALPAFADTPAQALSAFSNAWNAVNGYTTTVNCYSVKGDQNQVSTYNYSFTKPSSITMGIVSGPSAGNTVWWSGGNSVTAGRGMFKKSFNLNDPTVTSLRGATVVDLSFGAILKHAQETKGTQSASATTLDGAAVTLLNLNVADPTTDDGVTREALYLSNASNLPVRVDAYTGSNLVNSCTFSGTTKT